MQCSQYFPARFEVIRALQDALDALMVRRIRNVDLPLLLVTKLSS